MCHTEGPGSEPPESTTSKARVISLCDHRERRDIEAATDQLVDHLELIHHRAIQVHNAVIERAGVSVLSELCRTAALLLDDIDENLRAAVLIPAALYGRSDGDIFGKAPLQERIAGDIEDPEASKVLERLNDSRVGVWNLETREDEPTDHAVPVAGPDAGDPTEIAALLERDGPAEVDGLYTGRMISFRDWEFILFGHRLDRPREVAVRDMLTSRDDAEAEGVWRRIELELIRAIVDPEDRHQWPGRDLEDELDEGIRRPASRNGLMLRIRRAIWRHFAEPDEGLTFHAHLAALADDAEAFEALVDEIDQIADTVEMKSGGLRDGVAPIETDEILRPFHIDGHGRLGPRECLQAHPIGVLLLTEVVFEATPLEADQPIAEALKWADDHEQTTPARTIELAWMTYSTEQNLMATYGLSPGCDEPADRPGDELPFARRSPVLPNLSTLFDPRFLEYSLADLDLDEPARRDLADRLATRNLDLQDFALADVERDERDLVRQWGVDHETCNQVRAALLELATNWRFERTGVRADDYDGDDLELSDRVPRRPGGFGTVEHFDEYLDD